MLVCVTQRRKKEKKSSTSTSDGFVSDSRLQRRWFWVSRAMRGHNGGASGTSEDYIYASAARAWPEKNNKRCAWMSKSGQTTLVRVSKARQRRVAIVRCELFCMCTTFITKRISNPRSKRRSYRERVDRTSNYKRANPSLCLRKAKDCVVSVGFCPHGFRISHI